MVVVLVAPAAAAPLGGSREPLLVAILVPPAVVLPGGHINININYFVLLIKINCLEDDPEWWQ